MTKITTIHTAQQLRALGRELPDRLSVVVKGAKDTLDLYSISRHLVGRRLAGVGVWGTQSVFVKLFFGGRDALTWQAGKEFRREIKMSKAMEQHGVASAPVIASGQLEGGGFWLAQRLLPNLIDFKQSWLAHQERREVLFFELMCVVKQLYQAGLYQADAHLENFAYSEGRLYALDAGGVKSTLSKTQLLRNLALVIAQFHWSLHRQLVESAVDVLGDDLRSLVDRLPGEVNLAWRKRVRKLSHKMLRPSSWVRKLNTPYTAALLMRRADSVELQELLSGCDSLNKTIAVGKPLKAGNSATVAMIRIADEKYVVKRYNLKSHWVAFKRAFGRSRARRSWLGAHLLDLMGVDSLIPVGMLEERRWGLVRRAYFVSSCVNGIDAHHFFQNNLHRRDEESICSIIDKFVNLFEALLYAGVSHGDMKATNFLISEQVDQVSVIDLDAVVAHSSMASAVKANVKDLHRFLDNFELGSRLHQEFFERIERMLKTYGASLK